MGIISTAPRIPLSQKLRDIYTDIESLIDTYHPSICGIEKLFFLKNITTGIDVAHARGVILLSLINHGVPIAEYTPLQVKKSLTGNGIAKKRQIQNTLKTIFHLSDIPKPDDAADALAIAYIAALGVRM
jgi:crossover junction endodeoxyribonuclease RuvC